MNKERTNEVITNALNKIRANIGGDMKLFELFRKKPKVNAEMVYKVYKVFKVVERDGEQCLLSTNAEYVQEDSFLVHKYKPLEWNISKWGPFIAFTSLECAKEWYEKWDDIQIWECEARGLKNVTSMLAISECRSPKDVKLFWKCGKIKDRIIISVPPIYIGSVVGCEEIMPVKMVAKS